MRLSLLLTLLISTSALATGKITFVKGEVTSLKLKAGVRKSQPVKKNHKLFPGRSYLTHELSQVVVQLDDGTWLRVGADTKFEVKEKKEHFLVTVHTGTLRVLYSSKFNAKKKNSKTKKLVIQTPDAHIETAEGKLTLTYMPLFQHTSVYVEKGMALLTSIDEKIKALPVTIHAGEFSEFVKTEQQPRASKEMSEREQNMLKLLLFSQLKTDKEKDKL